MDFVNPTTTTATKPETSGAKPAVEKKPTVGASTKPDVEKKPGIPARPQTARPTATAANKPVPVSKPAPAAAKPAAPAKPKPNLNATQTLPEKRSLKPSASVAQLSQTQKKPVTAIASKPALKPSASVAKLPPSELQVEADPSDVIDVAFKILQQNKNIPLTAADAQKKKIKVPKPFSLKVKNA